MKFPSLRLVFCALAVAIFSLGANAAQPAPPAATGATTRVAGQIKVANVQGEVSKENPADKSRVALKNGDVIGQGLAIITGRASSVVLVFANGTTIKLGADTNMSVDEFLIDPLTGPVNVGELAAEPTTSTTKLNLAKGELIGDVKHLNRDKGSTFSVQTPIGAAGIRGTTFRIVFIPTGDGLAFNFVLSTSDGIVLFQGTTQGSGVPVNVPKGQEIVVVATVDATTKVLNVAAPASAAGPISAEATSQIQNASVQILQTQLQTTFSKVDFQPVVPSGPVKQPPSLTPGTGL